MRRRLKVLLLFDAPYPISRGHDFGPEFEDLDWSAEDDVNNALIECGYEVSLLGLFDDISILLEEIRENKPDVIFNLAEVFRQKSCLEQNVASLLEMLGIPYTGASPTSLLICNNKALTKKILTFHGIHVPKFCAFYRGHRIKLVKRLQFPLIVKPLREEASRGISLGSVVEGEGALLDRVRFIHKSLDADAIVEEYIEGREFYVSVLGSKRVRVLPLREMRFGKLPADEARIATYKAKWDFDYRKRWGIKNVFAGRLPAGMVKTISSLCKRAYRVLNMQCYARFDIRVARGGSVYIIEANANPCLDIFDELALSAEKAGISYETLIKRIVKMGLERTS